jgi:hypothetical protein
MTSMNGEENSTEVVLKSDVLGRVKTPLERREALVDEFEKSGMSGQAFAKWAGLNYQTFATWVQKRRKKTNYYEKKRVKRSKGVNWFEAVIPGNTVGNRPTVIHLSGGVRVEAPDAKSAIEILKELGVRVC